MVHLGLCTLLWCLVGAKLLEKESCSSADGLGAGDEQVELAGGTGGNEQRRPSTSPKREEEEVVAELFPPSWGLAGKELCRGSSRHL